MRLIFAACAVCLGSVGSANAMTQERPSEQEAATEADEIIAANRIVCRRYPPPTGSRIGARNICLTQSQWDRLGAEQRNMLDEAFNRSKVVTF
ncbi:MAG: hypothetical protein ABR601_04185 [Parasphingopyxis sp.]